MKKINGLAVGCAGFWVAALAWGVYPVAQSERQLPVIRDADVVVVGGGSAAVAAALAAKTNGASVFLVAPRNYLGDDLAGTRELRPAPVPEFATQPLAQKIFALRLPFTYTISGPRAPRSTPRFRAWSTAWTGRTGRPRRSAPQWKRSAPAATSPPACRASHPCHILLTLYQV